MEASPTPKNGQVYKYKGPFPKQFFNLTNLLIFNAAFFTKYLDEIHVALIVPNQLCGGKPGSMHKETHGRSILEHK